MASVSAPEDKSKTTISGLAAVGALVVLIAFGAFTVYLIRHAGSAEPAWTRLVFLYGGVEAIVFAAAGALWGTSVQRQRAEAAEKKAEKNEADAEVGRALEAQVRAFGQPSPSAPSGQRSLGTEKVGAATSPPAPPPESARDFAEGLVRLAEEMRAAR